MTELVDFRTRQRQRLEKDAAATEFLREEQRRFEVEKNDKNVARIQDMLGVFQKLTGEGRIDGVILIGHDPLTGAFITRVSLTEGVVPPDDYAGYLGKLTSLQLYLADLVEQAPEMDDEGNLVDPYEDMVEVDENGFPIDEGPAE